MVTRPSLSELLHPYHYPAHSSSLPWGERSFSFPSTHQHRCRGMQRPSFKERWPWLWVQEVISGVGGWRSEEGQVFDTHCSSMLVKISPQRGNCQLCGRAEVSSHSSLVQWDHMLLPTLCSPWHGPSASMAGCPAGLHQARAGLCDIGAGGEQSVPLAARCLGKSPVWSMALVLAARSWS